MKFDKTKPALYLLKVIGDVEPEIAGPFKKDTERVLAARAHRHQDPDIRDGLYRINYHPKKGITVDSFAGFEIDNVDEEE